MNSAVFVCFLLGCMVLGQAMYVKRPSYPIKQKHCYDYVGRPVYPGQSYYDGCNTCTCGSYGQPKICTRRYCGPVNPILPVKPVYPVGPIKPVYPVGPIKPVYPVGPIKPVYPVRPIKPVYPVRPIKPVYPVEY